MLKIKSVIQKILISGSALFLFSCGGGSGDGVPDPAPEILAGSITGIATLGPIADGTVTVYDFSSGVKGEILETATNPTDATGTYTLSFKSNSKAILICITGGSYEEAASTSAPKVNISFTTNDELCAVANYQTGQSHIISITYFTNLAYALALNSIKNSIAVTTAVTDSNKVISDWLGIDIIKTLPIDLSNSTSSSAILSDGHKYGFANAAVSNLMKSISTITGGQAFENVNSKILAQQAFKDAEAEGLLNGKTNAIGTASELQIGSQALTKIIYREDLGVNLISFANSAENKSSLNTIDSAISAEVTAYGNSIAIFNGTIFGTVPPLNVAPVANVDNVEITVGSAKTIFVLENDSDLNPGDKLFVMLDMSPVNGGTISLDTGNKTISYKANTNAVIGDTDSFTYFAFDGYVKSTTAGKVNINIVEGTNTAPVAKSIIIDAVAGVTKNILIKDIASDVDKNPLTVFIASQPASNANTGGSVVTAKADSIDYLAGKNITGEETFTYYVNDGNIDSNIATITVRVSSPVNTAPIANDDPDSSLDIVSFTAYYGDPVQDIMVLANDIDVETPLELSIKQANISILKDDGNATVNGKAISYKAPVSGVDRLVTFTYKATDPGQKDSATATVSVNLSTKPNLPPVFDSVNPVSPSSSKSVVIGSVAVDFVLKGNDPDSGPLALKAVLVNPTQTLFGTVLINGLTLTYTPPATGRTTVVDKFEVALFDGIDNSLTTVALVITATPNQSPVIKPLTAIDIPIAAPKVTQTIVITDLDGPAPLTVKVATPLPIGLADVIYDALTKKYSLEYTPPTATNAAGTLIQIEVSDGVSPLTLTKVNVTFLPRINEVPIFDVTSPVPTTQTATIGEVPVSFPVAASDPDNYPNSPVNEPLRIKFITKPPVDKGTVTANGLIVTYTPPPLPTVKTLILDSTFTYSFSVTDGLGDSAIKTVTVNLKQGNYAPIANPETVNIMKGSLTVSKSVEIFVLANDTDFETVDPNKLTIVNVTPTASNIGIITHDKLNNKIFYEPPLADSTATSTTFTYAVSDGAKTSKKVTVSIILGTYNAPPRAIGDASKGFAEPVVALSSNLGNGDVVLASVYVYFDEENDPRDSVKTTYKWYADGLYDKLLGEGPTLAINTNSYTTSIEVHTTVYAQTGTIKGDTVIAINYK